MKRIQLFEFEDFDWLPDFIRTGVTNLIVVLHKLLGTKVLLANLIQEIRDDLSFDQIVDLGSGSGGPMIDVLDFINSNSKMSPVQLILTDLHPNPAIVESINNKNLTHVSYESNPVDATNLEKLPHGLKTMINSFHHMPPDAAKKILLSAQENWQPILIYEIGENNIPTLLWWLLLPISLIILILMSFVMTPFVRPLTVRQLLFTYLIPIIPIVYAWDGQASIMRMYTHDDVQLLMGDNILADYSWAIRKAQKPNGKKVGYYILGQPLDINNS